MAELMVGVSGVRGIIGETMTPVVAAKFAMAFGTLSREGRIVLGRDTRTSLQGARLTDTPRRLELCRRAILERDFDALTAIVELDSDMMHAVMMTSMPALHYWAPASLDVMNAVRAWRAHGLSACYTVDAGANVHVLCLEKQMSEVAARLRQIAGVKEVLTAGVGGPAKLIE